MDSDSTRAEVIAAQDQPGNSQPATRNPADHLAAHRFAPGRSGNPGGRPKGASLTSMLREALDGDTLDGRQMRFGKTVGERLVDAMLTRAINGDASLIREVFNRVDGKAPERVAPTPPPAPNLDALDDAQLAALQSIAETLAGR